MQAKILNELFKACMGIVKKKSLSRSYMWPALNMDTEKMCKACVAYKLRSKILQKRHQFVDLFQIQFGNDLLLTSAV